MERKNSGISFFLNKSVRLIVEDSGKVFPRDGILKDFDELNYYIEMLQGPKKCMIIGFLKTTVRRIEPLNYSRGDSNNQY